MNHKIMVDFSKMAFVILVIFLCCKNKAPKLFFRNSFCMDQISQYNLFATSTWKTLLWFYPNFLFHKNRKKSSICLGCYVREKLFSLFALSKILVFFLLVSSRKLSQNCLNNLHEVSVWFLDVSFSIQWNSFSC